MICVLCGKLIKEELPGVIEDLAYSLPIIGTNGPAISGNQLKHVLAHIGCISQLQANVVLAATDASDMASRAKERRP